MGPAGPVPVAPGPGPVSAPAHLPPDGYGGGQHPAAQSNPELIELSGSDLEMDEMDGDATDAAAPIGNLDTLGYPHGGGPPPGPPP